MPSESPNVEEKGKEVNTSDGSHSDANDNAGGVRGAVDPEVKQADEDTIKHPIGIILGVGIPVVAALLGAVFFTSKKREVVSAAAFSKSFTLLGTGDHPRSFHKGLHHVTPNGQKYLSTQCKHCLARRTLVFSSDGADTLDLGTIPEDAPYDESSICSLKRADSAKGLAQHHMGMNVRRCTNPLCTRCKSSNNNDDSLPPQTKFLPATSLRQSMNDAQSFVISLFTDTSSTRTEV